MGLLDLVQQYIPPPNGAEPSAEASKRSNRSMKFASEVARKALNLMIILKPVTMVTTLAKEVSTYLASQHVTSYPHSSIQPVQVRPFTSSPTQPAQEASPNSYCGLCR